MTLQLSLELPVYRVERPEEFVTAEAITELTRAAAAAGFSAVNVSDHPAPDARWVEHGGHHTIDPFVALSFAATADPSVRLLTNIYVAAYRGPFLGAALVHSLDVLSAGRLILGVAAGYLRPEFAALGVEFERRGELLDEALAVMDAALAGGDVAWDGRGFTARGVRLRPRTPSGRRPPVWVGGNSKVAIRRAVRFEGWAPFCTGGFARASRTAPIESVQDLAAAIGYVRSLLGDRPRSFDVCWSEGLMGDRAASVDEQCARMAALVDAGVTWLTVTIGGDDRAEMVDGIEAFGRDVAATRTGG